MNQAIAPGVTAEERERRYHLALQDIALAFNTAEQDDEFYASVDRVSDTQAARVKIMRARWHHPEVVGRGGQLIARSSEKMHVFITHPDIVEYNLNPAGFPFPPPIRVSIEVPFLSEGATGFFGDAASAVAAARNAAVDMRDWLHARYPPPLPTVSARRIVRSAGLALARKL